MGRMADAITRRYFVSGRVQGVGFRDFVERRARATGVTGWVRNRTDGRVEVLATGTTQQHDELSGYLHQGPMLSRVTGVEQQEATPEGTDTFAMRR